MVLLLILLHFIQALLRTRCRARKEAAELLTCTNLTISEICFSSGFNDLSYFYRSFTAKYGTNPGEFRRRFQRENET